MELSRRGFLAALASGMVAATVDVDKLLWMPGAKKIFIPEPRIIRGNIFVTPEWVTAEAVKMFNHNIELIKYFNSDRELSVQ